MELALLSQQAYTEPAGQRRAINDTLGAEKCTFHCCMGMENEVHLHLRTHVIARHELLPSRQTTLSFNAPRLDTVLLAVARSGTFQSTVCQPAAGHSGGNRQSCTHFDS